MRVSTWGHLDRIVGQSLHSRAHQHRTGPSRDPDIGTCWAPTRTGTAPP